MPPLNLLRPMAHCFHALSVLQKMDAKVKKMLENDTRLGIFSDHDLFRLLKKNILVNSIFRPYKSVVQIFNCCRNRALIFLSSVPYCSLFKKKV